MVRIPLIRIHGFGYYFSTSYGEIACDFFYPDLTKNNLATAFEDSEEKLKSPLNCYIIKRSMLLLPVSLFGYNS